MFGIKKKSKKSNKHKSPKKLPKFKGQSGFTYPFGFIENDAYLFLGRQTWSIFDIVFQYGTNRQVGIGWVTRLIPSSLIEDGKVILVQRQKGVPKDVEDSIVGKRINSSALTMDNNQDSDARENSKNSSRITDLGIAASLSKNDVIVDSDIVLIVKGKRPKDVEQVIHDLKLNYQNDDIHGVLIVRRTGEQLKSLKEILIGIHDDSYHNTDMTTVAAGRMFMPSAGFSDPRGVFVGIDRYSLINNNPAIIDFSDIRNAVIYMGGVRPYVSIGGYEGGAFMQNGGTAVSHVIADGNYLNGGRTHHIVLSHNDFHTTDSLVFDMNKEAINPFEVFGSPETVVQDANANFDKVNTMLLMAAGAENNDYIKANLKSNLIDWYTYKARGNGIYSPDPEHEPIKAQRILASDDHSEYPVPGDFLLNANNMMSEAQSPEERRDAKLMYQVLSNLVASYPSVFNKHTTLPNVFTSNDRNIYYDLSNLGEDQKLTSIVFLNTLAYVTHRALPGEVIVIDGIDEMDLPVETLYTYKKRMDRKNIGLISVFEHTNRSINPISYEDFTGRLNQQDMVVLGGITPDDEVAFGRSWQESLPRTVANQLKGAKKGILYFYRNRDHLGALVDTHLIL